MLHNGHFFFHNLLLLLLLLFVFISVLLSIAEIFINTEFLFIFINKIIIIFINKFIY